MKAPEKEILGTKMNHRHRPKITALVVDDNMVVRAIHHRLLQDRSDGNIILTLPSLVLVAFPFLLPVLQSVFFRRNPF